MEEVQIVHDVPDMCHGFIKAVVWVFIQYPIIVYLLDLFIEHLFIY